MNAKERCESLSPIYKFDEGPRRCTLARGHEGNHWAKTSGGRHVDPQYDYGVSWGVSSYPADGRTRSDYEAFGG